ncbi:MAG TPA: IS1 family transposase, partial [Blastocatellia bacterium]|nr:IS1 family transposase [Blastocatellia bacterium]
MVTKIIKCYHCGSENIVRHGLTKNGKQRYLCRDCKRSSREDPQPNGYTAEQREEILRAYEERSSLWRPDPHFPRGAQHRQRLAQKKGATLPPLSETLLNPDPDDPESTSLELDELWSFVLRRVNKRSRVGRTLPR